MNASTVTPRRKDRILIVDDTPMNIQVLAQALIEKYDILVATSGKEALDIAGSEEKPDLILLDIMMPEMDGFETCKALKNHFSTQNIPIIFVSAKGDVSDQQYGFDLGAVDYITKPFEIPIVLARIKVHLLLKHKSEQLERVAMIDVLTDIPNRRALENSIKRECFRARRDKTLLSVLMIDVDHFKAFNDTYGHGAGDECLRTVAKTLEANLQRAGDMVGRYGGEEFVVVLPDCDQAGASVVAEKIRNHVEMLKIPNKNSQVLSTVTISVGLASSFCTEEDTWKKMLSEADKALYEAKNNGRNQICAASSHDEAV